MLRPPDDELAPVKFCQAVQICTQCTHPRLVLELGPAISEAGAIRPVMVLSGDDPEKSRDCTGRARQSRVYGKYAAVAQNTKSALSIQYHSWRSRSPVYCGTI